MSAEVSGFRRFWHWGPITALSIIKCITLTTLYMNSMWWPPNQTFGGFAHQALFLLLSTLATFNYVMATLTGPGLLPKQWQPKEAKDAEFLQYCKVCEGYKAPRSHHCRKCDRCVKKMDHHCPWINHCVGWANHAYFTYFLFFSILGSLHGTVVLCCSFYRGIYRYYYLTHGLDHQLKTIICNETGIEIWIVEKACYRRFIGTAEDDFIYPYDLGWWLNLRQVFSEQCQKRGDGVEWAVRADCDQYTLTREQLAQKEEKRARTRTFKCLSPVSGRWLPLFSQGWRVCSAAPCNDEPRIRLLPEDVIKVTRFRKHWLFGERVVSAQELALDKQQQRKGAIRGWFPRRSVVELIEMPPQLDEMDAGGEPAQHPQQRANGDRKIKSQNGSAAGSGRQQRNGLTKKYM